MAFNHLLTTQNKLVSSHIRQSDSGDWSADSGQWMTTMMNDDETASNVALSRPRVLFLWTAKRTTLYPECGVASEGRWADAIIIILRAHNSIVCACIDFSFSTFHLFFMVARATIYHVRVNSVTTTESDGGVYWLVGCRVLDAANGNRSCVGKTVRLAFNSIWRMHPRKYVIVVPSLHVDPIWTQAHTYDFLNKFISSSSHFFVRISILNSARSHSIHLFLHLSLCVRRTVAAVAVIVCRIHLIIMLWNSIDVRAREACS